MAKQEERTLLEHEIKNIMWSLEDKMFHQIRQLIRINTVHSENEKKRVPELKSSIDELEVGRSDPCKEKEADEVANKRADESSYIWMIIHKTFRMHTKVLISLMNNQTDEKK
jgi:hypothetical protein